MTRTASPPLISALDAGPANILYGLDIARSEAASPSGTLPVPGSAPPTPTRRARSAATPIERVRGAPTLCRDRRGTALDRRREPIRSHIPETGWNRIRANGLDFATFSWGEGPLVLLLHGFPDTAHTWDALGPRLADLGYRVVAPFMRGYAPTEIPAGENFSATDLGADVIGLIEALGAETASVVGHDWGAVAAYAAGHAAPERIDRLITVGIPHPATLRPRPSTLWTARHLVGLQLPGAPRRWRRGGLQSIRTLYERWSPTHDWPDSALEAVANALAAPGCTEAALGYYRCLGLRPPRLPGRIRVRSLVIGGSDDPALTAADFQRSARKFEAGHCEVRMLPGGHFLHLEHPEPFFEAVRHFLGAPS